MKMRQNFLVLLLCALLLTGLPSAMATGASAEISDDIYSFQAVIMDQLYTMPMSYSAFAELGWKMKGDDTVSLDAGYYTMETAKLGDVEAYIQVINFDINARPLNECYVAGLKFEMYQNEKVKDFSLVMPGGLVFGEAVREDAEAAYGTPSNLYEGTYQVVLTYTYESYREVKLGFDVEGGKLTTVDIRNFGKPEDFAASEVSDEVPAIVTRYTAPEVVGETLDSYTVSYGGVFYQLPAPVSVFVTNGWRVIAEDSETTVAGRDAGWVTLMKDNQRLRTLASNYSAQATAMENCFITEVESSDSVKVELLCPKGITVGMSEADLKAALEGETFETEESTSYTYYRAIPGESKLDDYEIYVRDGAVYKVNVSNSPKFDDYTSEQ